MDDNVLTCGPSATARATPHGGAAIPWSTRSNSGKTGSGAPASGQLPAGSHESATAKAEPAGFSTRSCQNPTQQHFHFRAPEFPLFAIPRPEAWNGPLETEDEIADGDRGRKQAKRFPALAFDGIAQNSRPRQALGYDQAEPRPGGCRCWTKMKVEACAPHHPPRRHDGCKLFRPVQALLRAKRSPLLRLRDDGGPWHDAHVSQHDHRGYACARGSRGYACGAQPKAGRCVSWQYPLIEQKRRITSFCGCFVKRNSRRGCG